MKVQQYESCLLFDLFESEIDVNFKHGMILIYEELVGGIDVGNPINQRV